MPSKRFKEIVKGVDKDKKYGLDEAIELLKQGATAKFDETVELHFQLGIDPKKSDQQIRATLVLPHGTGKTKRVIVFADSANESAAKEAGADIVGTEETIAEIVQKGVIDFDVAIAVPTMMPKLAKAARVLGPRGLMPNPKTDTVGTNIAKMVAEQKGGKISFKNDNTSNLHIACGKASFETPKLKENLETVIEALKKSKPAASKGIFIKKAILTSTMGAGIALEV